MRRIIMLFLAVVIVMTTVACGKKEDPEPFFPLDIDSTIVSIVDHANPELSSTRTSVAYIREALEASKWIKTSLSSSEGTLVYTILDSKEDSYDFYDGSQDFVIVTRQDKSKLAYTFDKPILTLIEDYLNELAEYDPNAGFRPFKYDFVSFTDYSIPGAVFPLSLIQNLRSKLTFAVNVSSVSIDPTSGILSYSVTDIMGDHYDFYRAEQAFMIVTHTDLSTRVYTIDVYGLDTMNNHLATFLNNPVFTDHRTYQYYQGDLDGFSDEKLIDVFANQNDDIQKSLFTISYYPITESQKIQDAEAGPVQLILKDDQGTYVFMYTNSVKDMFDSDALVVSVGKSFDGTDHRFYVTDYYYGYHLITEVAYPAISGSAAFDLSSYTFTQVEILKNGNIHSYIKNSLSRPYDFRFKAIIDRYATVDWEYVSEVDETRTTVGVKMKTNTKTMIYLAIGFGIYLVLDEDPSTPGAVYYKATTNDKQVYDWMKAFNYAAQIPLPEVPSIGKIISVNDYDPAYTGENGDPGKMIDLTPTQSDTITALLKPTTWTAVNYYDYEYYLENEILSFKTDDGKRISFDVTTTDYDRPYVRFFIYQEPQWGFFYMPYEVYADLLKAIEAIR